MKATHVYSLLALAAGAAVAPQMANAQQPVYTSETVSVSEFSCDPKTHYSSNWRDNWFIQIGAGINQPFVERTLTNQDPSHAIDRKKMTVTYNFGFGRWFSPYLGFRINALGGAMHWDTPTPAQPMNGWSRGKHVNLNAELMWDMFNTFGGVNSDRVFSIIPFVGIGGDYMWDIRDASGVHVPAATNIYRTNSDKLKTSSWTLPVTAGLQFRFRLCEYVDFFAEARASFMGDNWNNVAYGDAIEANVAVLGGFNFNIGGRNWNEYNECASLSQIAALNGEVNALRAQNLAADAAIAELQSQLPCPEAKVIKRNDCVNAPLMTTVRFTIDSAVISPEEEVNVYNMAQWLKDNPDQNVTIVGYADKDTGTSEYNLQLSKQRAEAVRDQLVNKYGINSNRLTVKYDGSDVQPYSTNNWNRIVIFTQPE